MSQAIRNDQRNRSHHGAIRRLALASAALLAFSATAHLGRFLPSDTPPVEAAAPAQVQLGGAALSAPSAAVGGSTEPSLAAPVVALSREALPSASAAPGSILVPAPIWQGTAGQEGYIRSGPTTKAERVGEVRPGQPLRVVRWVSGEEVETENTTWADLGNGRYVYSALLRSRTLESAPPPPAEAPTAGRWIDINLTLQVATAYEGTTAVKSVLISSGRPGWETPRGTFAIQRRVAKETMDGRTLIGQGPNGAGASYKVENVRWTQYFTADGSAIHENYWRNPALFGIPGSHGCIGMRPADAAWFWDFATTGTPIVIH